LETGFEVKERQYSKAIGIAANYVNSRTPAEEKLEEQSKASHLFKDMFVELKAGGVDLENIVYYRGETHYYVMTAKKPSLLTLSVLKKDYPDQESLLASENVNRQNLIKYVRIATTQLGLPETCEPVKNSRGDEDIQIFDFSKRKQATEAAKIKEVNGSKLLIALVGDALIEPFWPEGLGINRGFLGVLDFAYMLAQYTKKPDKDLIEERNSFYEFMSKISGNNLKNLMQPNHDTYSFNPNTRYAKYVKGLN